MSTTQPHTLAHTGLILRDTVTYSETYMFLHTCSLTYMHAATISLEVLAVFLS